MIYFRVFSNRQPRQETMKSTLIGAALVVSAALATPASAQHVITNPGYCAQFYPNANCQNYGPGNPYTSSYRGSWTTATPGWTVGMRCIIVECITASTSTCTNETGGQTGRLFCLDAT